MTSTPASTMTPPDAAMQRTALSALTCHDRLLTSHHGYLACTRSDQPTVISVDLEQVDGQLLVKVPDRQMRDQLRGQAVALSVGQHAFRLARGWTVIAQGTLAGATNKALSLQICEVDGATFVRTGTPPTDGA